MVKPPRSKGPLPAAGREIVSATQDIAKTASTHVGHPSYQHGDVELPVVVAGARDLLPNLPSRTSTPPALVVERLELLKQRVRVAPAVLTFFLGPSAVEAVNAGLAYLPFGQLPDFVGPALMVGGLLWWCRKVDILEHLDARIRHLRTR